MDTLLLNPSTWDLMIDAGGNIAVASNPYAIAQDVASAVKLFLGELYYDTTKGVPYLTDILGQERSAVIFTARLITAALTVPEVEKAQVTELVFNKDTRSISGSLSVIDTYGVAHNVTF